MSRRAVHTELNAARRLVADSLGRLDPPVGERDGFWPNSATSCGGASQT
jgi:hypothetical protein